MNNKLINSDENEEQSLHWDISKDGLIILKRSLRHLRLYKPYQVLNIKFKIYYIFSIILINII